MEGNQDTPEGEFTEKVQVLIRFEVDVDGSVINAEIASAPQGGFDESALQAIRGWRFKPGTQDGKAVLTRMRLPLVFHPQAD